MVERRRFTRVTFRTPVTVISPRLRIEAKTENLSIKGTYVRTPVAVDPGERIWLRLAVHDGGERPLLVPGTVVRQDGDGIGIEFAPLELDTFLTLKDIVAGITGDERLVMAELFRFVQDESNHTRYAFDADTSWHSFWDSPPRDEGGPEAT